MLLHPLVAVSLLAVVGLGAQDPLAEFRPASVTIDGRAFAYQLLLPPPPPPGQRLPLVVFLHGIGERGSDNDKQLAYLPRQLAAPSLRRQFPCFLLALQCPEDAMWVDIPGGVASSPPLQLQATPPLRAVMAALERVLAAELIDPERVYLTGLSMGGYGSWELAMRLPEQFAAVVPICGGGDERQAERLLGVPIWAFHGANDPVVPPARSRDLVAAIRARGGVVRYSELPDTGHDSWRQAYGEAGALAWMFAQDRRQQARGPQAPPALVPWPTSVLLGEGRMPWPAAPRLAVSDPRLRPQLHLLAEELELLTGCACLLVDDPNTATVQLRGDRSLAHEWELSTSDCVEITGRSVVGIDHAIAALLQLLAGMDGTGLPLCAVHDAAVPFAGVLVDCSSAVVPVAALQESVRLCWLYRVPHLLLQFGGDATFTFPSQTFPELVTPGRGYTRGELVDLSAYARGHGVVLVPLLDLGHAGAIVRQQPAWGLDRPIGSSRVLHFGKQAVLDDVGRLATEMLELFPESTFVHLGGAPAELRGLLDDAAAAAALQRCGGKEPADLVVWCLGRLCEQVHGKGRTPLLWDCFSPTQSRFVPEYTVVCATTGTQHAPTQLLATFPLLNASPQPLQIAGGEAARMAGIEALFAWEPHRFGGDPALDPAVVTVLPKEAQVFGSLLCLERLPGDGVVAALRTHLPAFAERALHADAGRPLSDFLGRCARSGAAARRR